MPRVTNSLIIKRRPLAVAAAVLACLATPSTALAALGQGGSWFSWSEQVNANDCKDPTDPISAVFYGSGVRGTYMQGNDDRDGHVAYHAGWKSYGPDITEVDQFHSQGRYGCRRSVENQPAGRPGLGNDRGHIRLWFSSYPTNNNQPVMLGTPHFENWDEGCRPPVGNHAVESNEVNTRQGYDGSGFDKGRRYIGRRFRRGGHHGVSFSPYVGNTAPQRQCNGRTASSNGHVAYISVGRP
jgi:hypothetical protein